MRASTIDIDEDGRRGTDAEEGSRDIICAENVCMYAFEPFFGRQIKDVSLEVSLPISIYAYGRACSLT